VTDTVAPTAGVAQLSHREILTIFSGLVLGMLLAALDQTIVATALPTITGELGGLNHLSWVVTSYLLATTVSTPLYGKLGDLYGRKRLFQTAIVVFLVGSLLCGAAQTMGQLIAFRAIQGVGGGGLMVLAMAIIGEIVSPRERGRYQGYIGAVFGVASVLGPLLGGFITDNLSWRWVFYVNLPIGLVALVVTSIVLPAGLRHGNPRIDFAGAALMSIAATAVVLTATWGGTEYEWGSSIIIGLIVVAVVTTVAFLAVERRAPEPLLPLRLFGGSTFRVATSASFVVGVAMFGAISFLPLFLQVVSGASATNSGLLLLPLMGGVLAASIGSGRRISYHGHYKRYPVLGMALATAAMALLATMGTDTSSLTVSAYMVLLGAGLGFTMQTLVLATQNDVVMADLGVATASVSFFRSLGGSIGVALFGAVFNASLSGRLGTTVEVGEGSSLSPSDLLDLPPAERATTITAFADALTDVFLYATPLLLIAFFITLRMRETPLRRTVDDPSTEDVAGAGPAVLH
jgi:EmrB/QacA subfamily drug resistance transporter